jgi:hypothetical protein
LCLVWVFRLSTFHSPPPEVGPLPASIASFSHCHLLQRCSGQIAPEPSPVDCFAFCFMFYLVSLYFVHLFYFVLLFICILFLLGFLVFALVFPCIASLCLFRVFFFVFTVLPIFSAPVSSLSIHCRAFFRAPTASNFQRVLQCRRFACTRSVSRNKYWSEVLSSQCQGIKCWLEVLIPQCQGISVGLGFSAPSVKE